MRSPGGGRVWGGVVVVVVVNRFGYMSYILEFITVYFLGYLVIFMQVYSFGIIQICRLRSKQFITIVD